MDGLTETQEKARTALCNLIVETLQVSKSDTIDKALAKMQTEADTLQKQYQENSESELIKSLVWERRTGIITAMDILREMRGEI